MHKKRCLQVTRQYSLHYTNTVNINFTNKDYTKFRLQRKGFYGM